MPFRHFYLLSHYICNGLLFLFSVCWLHVNEFNSFWEELRGERSEVYCLFGRHLCHGILFTCSHITFAMVYSFYFLCFGSRRNEYNSFLGIRMRGQKSTTYSENISVMKFYLLTLSTMLTFFQVSLMIRRFLYFFVK